MSVGLQVQAALFLQRCTDRLPRQAGLRGHVAQREHDLALDALRRLKLRAEEPGGLARARRDLTDYAWRTRWLLSGGAC